MNDEDLKRLFEENAKETRQLIEGLDQKLSARMDRLDGRIDSLDGRMDSLDGRMDVLDRKIDETAASLRRHFDVTAEGLRSDIRLLADAILHVDQKVDRLEASMR